MGSAVLLLSVLLATIFLYAGVAKLTDVFDAETHKLFVDASQTWAPLFQHLLDRASISFKLQPQLLLFVFGFAEAAGSLLLLSGTNFMATLANIVLIFDM